MSVMIIRGKEYMVCQYKEIYKQYGCKAKTFVKEGDRCWN
jgi:hypothetical protein